MELTDSLKKLLSETALQLKGAAKRRFMAQTVLRPPAKIGTDYVK